ncbi:ENTH domain-containing protein [Psidium guajava]|nr:ENTH domain-containing protein [Psidium guajava]
MGTFESFRKAYGALKDSTKVGLAKVNSEFKDLDIAIVKATNHVECPPKERHVRKIFSATSVVRPRADVAYCIHALSKRLSKTRNWIVALKTLIVIHRTLREGDPTFREELLNYSQRGHILQISNFKDDSSPLAWDCSAWVRTYALFLEERLECFRILKYDIETERLTKSSPGSTKAHSRTRLLNGDELLEQLPALQQLLYRLIGCQPEGAAYCNYLIQYALALVLKESFKIYCAINDGIINLVDMFFDMSRHDAVKALNIYKRAGQQAENLADFYEYCKGLELARNFQFPTLRQPPPSFLATMEEYIKEAPQTGSVSKRLEYRETDNLSVKMEEPAEPSESEKQVEEVEEKHEVVEEEEEKQPKEEVDDLPLISTADTGDLLGLNEVNPKAAELEESNALALAIIPPEGDPLSSANHGLSLMDMSTGSGWELALVTTPTVDISKPVERRMAGGFDNLLLDSLYEDEAARRQIQLQNAGYAQGMAVQLHNPFDQHPHHHQPQHDPFAMSSNIAAPTNVQMALMAQQQQQLWQQQQQQQHNTMMMVPYDPVMQYSQQHHQQPQHMPQAGGSSNPFGDPFPSFPQHPMQQQENHHLL